MSTSVPRSIVRSQVAPTKPRCASSAADSRSMASPLSRSMAATASTLFAALRSTAVANTSMRLQSKYRARFACPLRTLAARRTPSSVNVPSSATKADSPAMTLSLMRLLKSLLE